MSAAAYVLLPALLCSAALNWHAAWRQDLSLYHATKPAVLIFLIALFIIWGGLEARALPFLAGLGLSLLGDIFLIPRSLAWFLTGLIAFFLAHLVYICGFNAAPAPLLPTILIGAAALLVLTGLFIIIFQNTTKKPELKPMRRVFLPYAAVLVLMAASGVLCLFRPEWPLQAAGMCAAGGLLFFFSDLMHGADRMGKRIPHGKFWIIATYHLGQFLIAFGAAQWTQLSLPH